MKRRRKSTALPFEYCTIPLGYYDNWFPHLSPIAHKVYTVIMRKTWGYQKESDVLAIAQIVTESGMPRRSVNRGLQELRAHFLIECDGPLRHPKLIKPILSRLMQKPGSAYLAQGNVVSIAR